MALTMQEIRENVAARVTVADDTIVPDILSSDQTHDNLIRILDVMTAPPEKGGGEGEKSFGRKLYISALHRDHSYDGELGPHAHVPADGAPGWAVDIAGIDGRDIGDNPTTHQFVIDCLTGNKHVASLGTIGAIANDQHYQDLAAQNGKGIFEDEGTGNHVHLQSSEGAVRD